MTTAAAPLDLDPAAYAGLSDDDLIAMAQAQGEVIVVWDERAEKPFDRDTELRLGEDDLRGRGVIHLGDALRLVPEVTVREAGRGGQNLDIRGARKGGVRVLVDGIPLDDPFYGTFDLSTIAVTDVVQIRVGTSPSSPIDGPGGPGGVVEVHTRDAIGDRVVTGQASGDTLPTAAAAATGRGQLAPAWGLRLSATGTLGDHGYAVPGGEVDEDRHFGGGAARVEWRPAGQRYRRAVLDAAGFERAFLVPPADDDTRQLQVIDRDLGARATAGYEDRLGGVQVAARLHAFHDARLTRYFPDAMATAESNREDLRAGRYGGVVLADRPVGRTMRLIGAAHLVTEDARVEDGRGMVTAGRSTIGEVAAGWQVERGPWKLDAAGGVAFPIGVGASPWPEAKLVGQVKPVAAVALVATVARKGRLPTLRERFGTSGGNAALDPEQTSFAEAKVVVDVTDRVRIETASWARRQTGLIKYDVPSRMLVNLGEVAFVGSDARVEVEVEPRLTASGAWSFVEADDATYEAPLDNLPRHRLRGELRARPWAPLTATARLSWTASRLDQQTVLAAYADVEAELVWQARPGWLVSARGDDLLDRRWDLHVGIPSAGRTFTVAVQGELR
ncbi:MAG: TonB-dependent receptor [Kofleriaceae bacterium]|nr:TonB-dependent receptor [Kofleriaceae bacterium]MCB9573288.1 TonB-dependent receptor [Kofleriaceae bacterium]